MLLTDLQDTIERQYSKQHIHAAVREAIDIDLTPVLKTIYDWCDADHWETKKNYLQELKEIDLEPILLEVLAILIPTGKTTLTALVGQLAWMLPFPYIVSCERIGELIYHMATHDLVDMENASTAEEGSITVSSPWILDEKTNAYLQHMRFLPPLVCPPRHLHHNQASAYRSIVVSNMSRGIKHTGNICLDVLNISNAVEFSVNIPFLKSTEDTLQDEYLNRMTQDTCIDLYHWGNRFYFSGFYDSRGRKYCRGYHLSFQGNDYRKAMLDFANQQELPMDEKYVGIFN